MYNYIIRDDVYLTELKRNIEKNYTIEVLAIEPAKRGFYGETWKVIAKDGNYFMKISYMDYHKEVYRDSLPVIEYLHDNGLHNISKIVKTKEGNLSLNFNGGVLVIFNYMKGENAKDFPKEKIVQFLSELYKVPVKGLNIDTEDFSIDCAIYVLDHIKEIPLLMKNQDTLYTYWNQLYQLSELCKQSMEHFFITHGDSRGNVMIDSMHFAVVDWDNPKLAPPERDLWSLICDSSEIKIYEKILSDHGVKYELQSERIKFYCYYNYFYYLRYYVIQYFKSKGNDTKITLNFMRRFFFHGWINQYIERMKDIM